MAGPVSGASLSSDGGLGGFEIVGRENPLPEEARTRVLHQRVVTLGYLQAMGIVVIRGRGSK